MRGVDEMEKIGEDGKKGNLSLVNRGNLVMPLMGYGYTTGLPLAWLLPCGSWKS